ncbi:hypothetical protein L1987_32621 [Smallanthus sonchifolius]|uniref:Uncharacterized protein n=1 Tax=Smallanthus sonchifolius TaxID=185202 RepID=A0ACB9HQ31_9ASTR|nr:hypothetical protein L1987_32621 [Smallanthus sonchifolius]
MKVCSCGSLFSYKIPWLLSSSHCWNRSTRNYKFRFYKMGVNIMSGSGHTRGSGGSRGPCGHVLPPRDRSDSDSKGEKHQPSSSRVDLKHVFIIIIFTPAALCRR